MHLVLLSIILILFSISINSKCIEDLTILNLSQLSKWEKNLLKECPSSALGDIRPLSFLRESFDSTKQQLARAHIILGFKALHNFFYDLCKYEFDKAIFIAPYSHKFVSAYWGRALCESHLLWNSENITASRIYLNQAPIATSEQNTLYVSAVIALNGGNIPLLTADAIHSSRSSRYKAYLKALKLLSLKYPNDKTARSFVALATLAVGSVGECATEPTLPSCVTELKIARQLLLDDYNKSEKKFPGTLHYGMHAHDFPNNDIVRAGLIYAKDYPKYVTSATHSLHMSSHLYDRLGEYRLGATANKKSIAAHDQFIKSGALRDIGMSIDYSYAFNANNVYHSLEYEHYELLQLCARKDADKSINSMINVVHQSIMHTDSEGIKTTTMEQLKDAAWYKSTVYIQWELKMLARQTMWSIATSMMTINDMDLNDNKFQFFEQQQWYSALTAPTLPRLAWTGTHEYYSPLSEAGYYASVATAILYKNLLEEYTSTSKISNNGTGPFDFRIQSALLIIDNAALHYKNKNILYEYNNVQQLGLQVRALLHVVQGELTNAISSLQKATQLEYDAPNFHLPSSTTLFFFPSSAWEGIFRLFVANVIGEGIGLGNIKEANKAFQQCLTQAGHPNMPLCLIGKGRTITAANEKIPFYLELLRQWGRQNNGTVITPVCECDILINEALVTVGWIDLKLDLESENSLMEIFVIGVACIAIGLSIGFLVGIIYSNSRTINRHQVLNEEDEDEDEDVEEITEMTILNSTER